MARSRTKKDDFDKSNTGGDANLSFETQLFLAAGKLRGNMDVAVYKYLVLSLIFFKYVSENPRCPA